MTFLIEKGPYQRASSLGDGQSMARSTELSHT
jgi:hypothetical protein